MPFFNVETKLAGYIQRWLGPVNMKRRVALPGVWLSGEAPKPGHTLCGLDRLRQQSLSKQISRGWRVSGVYFDSGGTTSASQKKRKYHESIGPLLCSRCWSALCRFGIG